MDKEFKQLENLLKGSRITDPKSFIVDTAFKESLRKELYEHYLSQEKKGESIMKRLKNIFLTPKVALISSAALILLIAVFTIFGVSNRLHEEEEEATKEVLLAANLAVVDGDVDIKKADEEEWSEGLAGDTLNQGDTIRTGPASRAILELDSGDAVRLNSESEIRLENMKPEVIVIEQLRGESYSRVAKSDENTYTIRGEEVEASALGTAYIFKLEAETKTVSIYVYESKVRLKVQEDESEVVEMEKAIVDFEKRVEITKMEEDEYKSEFALWNREKDQEGGFECHEEIGPQVTITSPGDGSETEAESIAVKGTVTDDSSLKKIVVNGNIYTSKDENGKGFDLSEGTFDVDVALVEGVNEIKVKAYDIYWNASEEVTITVTRKIPPPPAPSKSFYISHISSPAEGKIHVKWVMSGYSSPHGFKVVVAKHTNPVYPGDDFEYVSDPDTRELTWTVLRAATYYVKVCIYNGAGGCTLYTPEKTVIVEGNVSGDEEGVDSIALSGLGSNISWIVDGYSVKGFKVVWSKNPGPTYPTRVSDEFHYLSDPNATSDTLNAFDGAGTYYVRVCEYLGGKCGVYSNQITVEM